MYWTLSNDTSLQLNIENLTNTDYYPHAHSTHQASVGEILMRDCLLITVSNLDYS